LPLCLQSVVLADLALDLCLHIRFHFASPPASAAVQQDDIRTKHSKNHECDLNRREVFRININWRNHLDGFGDI